MRQNVHEPPGLVRLAHRPAIRSVFVQHVGHELTELSLGGLCSVSHVHTGTIAREYRSQYGHIIVCNGLRDGTGAGYQAAASPPGRATHALIGPGHPPTSLTKAMPCPVASSPPRIARTLGISVSAAPMTCGTARKRWIFGGVSIQPTRRILAVSAPSIKDCFEYPNKIIVGGRIQIGFHCSSRTGSRTSRTVVSQ